MNLLIDTPQSTIQVDNREIELNTDFRLWIKFANNLESLDPKNTDIQEIITLIKPLIKSKDVYFSWNLFNGIIDFYQFEAKETQKTAKKTFDFDFDGNVIYSSFKLQYGDDIFDNPMHWHVFLTLFGGLSQDTPFMQRVKIRTTDIKKIEKSHKAEFRRAQKAVKLPDKRTDEQREADLNAELSQFF